MKTRKVESTPALSSANVETLSQPKVCCTYLQLARLYLIHPTSPSNISTRERMISRFARRAFAAPVRLNATRVTPALRTVTTDAASSHVEKSDVPSVCACYCDHALTASATDMLP